MESWREYLEELENTSDVSMPKKFYISIYFDDEYRPDIMKDLGANKVIKTVGASSSDIVGFSDNPSNFMQMHGNIRDATIVMDGKDFAEINDSIVKIEYDNPNFLAQDGLKAFYRLTEKNQKDEQHAERIIGNIFDAAEIGQAMWQVTREKVDNQAMVTMQNFLREWDVKTPLAQELYANLDRINNLDHLVELLFPVLEEQLKKADSWRQDELGKYISKGFLRLILYTGIISAAKMFEKENEWVVDTNVMNVPPSSILYIGGPAVKTKKIFNKMKRGELTKAEKFELKYEIGKMDKIMAAIEKYDLESKYKKLIITDMGTFNAARNKWQKRKRELEYGVQEMPKAAE
jgi:hypothetical protein